jgi:hypothetical protein
MQEIKDINSPQEVKAVVFMDRVNAIVQTHKVNLLNGVYTKCYRKIFKLLNKIK